MWIGAGTTTILPGVSIGRDAMIAAGVVVADDVPAASLVTGPKAKYNLELTFFGDYMRPPADSTLSFGERIGTITQSQAELHGYHSSSETSWAPVGGFYIKSPTNVQPIVPPNSSEEQAATIEAIVYGPPDGSGNVEAGPTDLPVDLGGDSVPAGGCWERVESEIDSPLTTDFNLKADLINLSLKHTDVRGAIEEWSLCMKSAGYRYPEVQAPSEYYSQAVLTSEEIKVAVADTRCTKSSRWADVFYAVLGDYEKQAIEKYKSTLESVVSSQSARLDALRRNR